MVAVNDAKRHEIYSVLNGDGALICEVRQHYTFHVRQFAIEAGLNAASMDFDVSESDEILTRPWIIPERI
jgi:hypothetical protein